MKGMHKSDRTPCLPHHCFPMKMKGAGFGLFAEVVCFFRVGIPSLIHNLNWPSLHHRLAFVAQYPINLLDKCVDSDIGLSVCRYYCQKAWVFLPPSGQVLHGAFRVGVGFLKMVQAAWVCLLVLVPCAAFGGEPSPAENGLTWLNPKVGQRSRRSLASECGTKLNSPPLTPIRHRMI